jgi:hypothetical protein
MMSAGFRTSVVLPIIFLVPFTVGLWGCASSPKPSGEHTDYDKIQQDSDKSMQDMKKEEERGGSYGY